MSKAKIPLNSTVVVQQENGEDWVGTVVGYKRSQRQGVLYVVRNNNTGAKGEYTSWQVVLHG